MKLTRISVPLDYDYAGFYRLHLPSDARTHGFMTIATVRNMPWTKEFEINHEKHYVQLRIPGVTNPTAINKAFQDVIDAAIAQNQFDVLHGDHSEPYIVQGVDYALHIERFTAPLFGIATRGAHMTGYTRTLDGVVKIWVARRSPDLFTYPGKLDTTVAGGVKAQHTPFQCIVEESDEEAALSKNFVSENVRSVGVITYMTQSRQTGAVHPDVLFLFDLELPESIVPQPHDGEVSEFKLLTVEEIKSAMFNGEFKPNCNLVMLDFFIRHGIVTPDNEPDYVQIQTRLHRKLPIPISPKDCRIVHVLC
jgi:isopentenyldiphosphate isomerase